MRRLCFPLTFTAVAGVRTESPSGRVRRPAGVVIVGVLLVLLAACRPAALSSATATAAATAAPIATSTLTPTSPLATATIAPTNTPPPTPPPSATSWPTETPYPTTLPSTSTPSPQPTLSVYEDVEIYAYIMNETWFQSGAYDDRLPGQPVNATYSAADEALAAELKTLIEGDIFVILTGDYYPAPDGNGHLVVKAFEYVNQLYTPETPFDVVFQQPGFNFSFRYPSGWFVKTQPGDDGQNSVRLSNAPFDINQLRPGREAFDPTWFYVSLHFEPMSLEAYIAAWQDAVQEDTSPDGPPILEVTFLEMGGRPVAQVIQTRMYRTVTYVVSWTGGVVIISPSAESGGKDDLEFIRRLVESMM